MFSLINIIILKTSTSTWWSQTPPRSPSPLTITTNPFALSTFSLWFNCHQFVYFTAYHTNISQAVYQLDSLQLWSKIIHILNGICPKILNFGKINYQPNAAWSHLDASVNYAIVGLDGGLPLTVRQALIWINDFLLLIAILGTSRYRVKICLIEKRFENTHFKLAAIVSRSRWVDATMKPVYNDHLMEYFSAFWSSSRWPRATLMSSRRQKLLPRVNWYIHSSLKNITE